VDGDTDLHKTTVTGNLSATGNITANVSSFFIGNGSQLTGIVSSYGNANVVANLAALGSNPVSTTGNITGGNLTTAGIANVATLAVTGSATVQGSISIFSSSTSLSATGNVIGGNVKTVGLISATGNVTANYFIGDGSQLTNLPGGNATLPLANGTSNFDIATANGNVTVAVAGARTWTFDTTGNVTIPGNIVGTATINIDNRATGNGADIQLYSADDILLQARDRSAGSTSEGGDINIFAGDSAEDSDNSGGDVIIEGGRGGAANVDFGGSGGFVRVEAGQGGDAIGASFSALGGGDLTLRAGDAGTNNGNIDLGNSGGDVIINAGDSTGNGVNGGTIYLTSGAADASALAGDVVIQAGGTWTFDGDGNLNLPMGGVVYETNIPDGGLSGSAIALKPTGGTNADQELLIYPTVNDANHLHLTTGNLYNTELFLGDDNLYVKLANTGNVVVNSNDDTGNTAQWTFGANGNLTLPGNIIAINYLNGNRVTGGVTFDGEAVIGTGTSNTQSGLYLAPDPVSLTNDLYLRVRGNILDEPTHIHFDTGNNQYYNQFIGDDLKYIQLANTGNIVVNSNDAVGNSSTWTFGTDSALTLPASSGQIGRSGYPNGIDLYNNNGGTGYVRMNYADESLISADSGGAHVQTTGGTWDFDTTGNLTAPGNVSAVGNIIGGNIVTSGSGGDITLTGGNIAGAGNISATGNVTAANFFGNGATLSNVATTFESTWTVPTGNSTQSFTVTPNNTYYMWVDCNITNGILAWNATATVTNNNVPVVGAQYAWVYSGGGTPIDFTSIPNQFVGTSNTIVRSSTAPSATTNRFDFDINNASGNSQTVRYGWAQIS
jgi:hypothetical protein